MFSSGNGEVLVLGLVPHSHIAVAAFSVEDGEIIKQVMEVLRSNMKCFNDIWRKLVQVRESQVKADISVGVVASRSLLILLGCQTYSPAVR